MEKLIAYLFVFYFSSIGAITPPVCAAVFLASGIAESNWLKTRALSVLLAIPAFVVPFTFAYTPALLLDGTLLDIIVSSATVSFCPNQSTIFRISSVIASAYMTARGGL